MDFVAEFTYKAEGATEEAQKDADQQWWKLYVDGSSNDCGAGAKLMLINLEGHKITLPLRFSFKASNNKAEYEALLAWLRLAKELKVGYLQICNDS